MLLDGVTSAPRFYALVSLFVLTVSLAFYSLMSTDSSLIFGSDVLVNDRLSDLQQISTDPHEGCESIVYQSGNLYTGSADGKLLKINDDGIGVFAALSASRCNSPSVRGRPLGIRILPEQESLVVADAYLGVYLVSLADGSSTRLFPRSTGFEVTFFDDLDVHPDGSLLVSEASTKYSLENIMDIMCEENPTGRLIQIDPNTGEWKQLLGGLAFPNGVQMHGDGKSVLVAETAKRRVLRVPLDGGEPTVFVANLPGLPDNIRTSPRGGYWIPVSHLPDRPLVKLLLYALESRRLRWIVLKFSKLSVFRNLRYTKSAMLIRVDENGKIVEVFRDPKHRVANVAEVHEYNNTLYTSSYFLPYIGKLTLA